MKFSLVVGLWSLLTGFCSALKLRLTLPDLFTGGKDIIKLAIEGLFIKNDLGLLLRFAVCENFNFTDFMPAKPDLIRRVINSLRRRKCPWEIEERFYNFNELQKSEAGRQFMLNLNVNFARIEWKSVLFTLEEVKEVFLKMQTYPPSQIEFLSWDSFAILMKKDAEFLCQEGHRDFFPIMSYTYFDSEYIKLWIDKVREHAAKDDLLFYRVVFLSWKYLDDHESMLKKLWESTLTEFQESVLGHYSKQGRKSQEEILEIPEHILRDNSIARAALHFDHLTLAFRMGYDVPLDRISKLFKEFKPSEVTPFACRGLLRGISYREFTEVSKEVSNEASHEWNEIYRKTYKQDSYFPQEFLLANAQLRLWRSSIIYRREYDLRRWELAIKEYQELKKKVATETDKGFTYINCRANVESIQKFTEGRIAEFLLYGVDLPKIVAIINTYSCKYGLANDEEYKKFMKGNIIDDLCSSVNDGKDLREEDVKKLLDAIIRTFDKWNVPEIVFASTFRAEIK